MNNENNCQNCNNNSNCIIYKLIKDKNNEELFISLHNLRCDNHSANKIKDKEEFKKDINSMINKLVSISSKLNSLSEISDDLYSISRDIDYFKDRV